MPPALAIETKSLVVPFEVKELDEGRRTFRGLAATWDLDLGGDVIRKGAFKRTITNWRKAKGRKHRLLDSHDRSTIFSVLGDLVDAEETDEGVLGEWGFLEGTKGDAAFALVKGGHVDSLSIGYEAIATRQPSQEEAKQGVWRFIDELKWLETSLVLFPMNPAAVVDARSVKSLLATPAALDAATPDDLRALVAAIEAKLAEVDAPVVPADDLDDPLRLRALADYRAIQLRSLGIAL